MYECVKEVKNYNFYIIDENIGVISVICRIVQYIRAPYSGPFTIYNVLLARLKVTKVCSSPIYLR